MRNKVFREVEFSPHIYKLHEYLPNIGDTVEFDKPVFNVVKYLQFEKQTLQVKQLLK